MQTYFDNLKKKNEVLCALKGGHKWVSRGNVIQGEYEFDYCIHCNTPRQREFEFKNKE